ncbi:phage tail assembly chaperone [Thioclava sp. BHET1]|uniref:rcc01693 family protein n=1 Tax=Thioclava dalianensis TaxID=1185766 RepID=UPI0009439354|nr:rcc01693 family protein [Thioclava dalianensis]TMV90170.1 phage tail assembly chaperone [Thioclava sp. BHET1]
MDWPGLMRAGLHQLRLTPAAFWALTPAELALMLGGTSGGARPLARAGLSELMARFPDETGERSDE